MLTLTLRKLERDGLLVRTVHPVVPPKVEYSLYDHQHDPENDGETDTAHAGSPQDSAK